MSHLQKSFSSANTFPAKILYHDRLLRSAKYEHKIPVIHVQLNPTNKCNFDCAFCSCSARDKSLELPFEEIDAIMTKARKSGCESVTITGGGEPLMYSEYDKLMRLLEDLEIEVGLVCNGFLLNRLKSRNSKNIIWCRISSSDDLPSQLLRLGKTTDYWFNVIDHACAKNPNIDWAFSHVLSHRRFEGEEFYFVSRLIDFANNHGFTHLRIVNDILKPVHNMIDLQHYVRNVAKVDDSIVIYQPRTRWDPGQNPCFLSILKPLVGADGFVYPCCGVQYALTQPSLDYEKTMRMGKATDLDTLFEKQAFFNGSCCVKCYYSNYNWALGTLLENVKHEKFI